jgi:tetratricopeptide (TPR) repeat protein
LLDFDEIDEKIKIVKLGIERFPKKLQCYLNCANYLSSYQDKHIEAETVLLSAIENGIESAAVFDALAELKIKQKEYEEAVQYYKKIFALEDFADIHARINFIIATIYLRIEDYDIAEKYLKKSLNKAGDENIKNAVYFGLILCYQKTNNVEKVVEFLRKFNFNREVDEEFQFCGRGYMSLGAEDYPLDYGMGFVGYSDIITDAVSSLEDVRDQFDFDNELNHKFFLLKAMVLEDEKEYEECLMYLRAALGASDSALLWEVFQGVFESMLHDEDGEYKKGRALTQYLKLFQETIEDFPVLAPILGGSVRSELVDLLFQAKKYKQIVGVCELYGHEDLEDILFEAAYSYNETEDQETSKKLYEKYLEENPESSAALNNLANIYKNENRIEEAVDLYKKAIEIDPDDEYAPRNLQTALNKKDAILQQEIRAQKEQEKQARIQQAAKAHWPSLDYNKKKVLMVLSNIDGFSGLDELANLCNMERRWAEIHYNKLVKRGMVIDDGNRFEINPDIKPLIDRESSHAVAINIIRSDESINFKPIFNSRLEYQIYLHMISLFPNHLVFPNMSLQSIFVYDRMKGVLEQDVFSYYLLTSVDICIVSTANYLPIVCYEVDSPYHDQPEQIERDEKKNYIFKIGGIPLIRLRAHGRPSEIEIKEKIAESTRQLGRSLDPTEKRNELFFKLLKNLEG